METGGVTTGVASRPGYDGRSDADGPSVVIYTDAAGTERVHPTSTLAEAIALTESLYNDYSVSEARVFLLREIEIDLKVVERVVIQPETQQVA